MPKRDPKHSTIQPSLLDDPAPKTREDVIALAASAPHPEMSFDWERFKDGHPEDAKLDRKQVMDDIEAFVTATTKAGHERASVVSFVLRWCSALFLEDAMPIKGLLARNIRERWTKTPETFKGDVLELWKEIVAKGVPLFDSPDVPDLTSDQLALLLTVTDRDWANVEPLILGSLTEGTMNAGNRRRLGAHFTPRAFVERLVRPTLEKPLREDLDIVRATMHLLQGQGKVDEAREALRAYHVKLCETTVLDPTCGAGNFLLVSLDTLKRIEADVITLWNELGGEPLDLTERTVSPKRMFGIEIEPLPCEVTKVLLWIGQLRWDRRFGLLPHTLPVAPGIENRDAVLAHDGVETTPAPT